MLNGDHLKKINWRRLGADADVDHDDVSIAMIDPSREIAGEFLAPYLDLLAAAPKLALHLVAATHALRSYQYGNGSRDLAESTADACVKALAAAGVQFVREV